MAHGTMYHSINHQHTRPYLHVSNIKFYYPHYFRFEFMVFVLINVVGRRILFEFVRFRFYFIFFRLAVAAMNHFHEFRTRKRVQVRANTYTVSECQYQTHILRWRECTISVICIGLSLCYRLFFFWMRDWHKPYRVSNALYCQYGVTVFVCVSFIAFFNKMQHNWSTRFQ